VLQRFADRGQKFLMSQPKKRSTAAAFGKALAEEGKLREALRLAGASSEAPVRSIVDVFPDVFKLQTKASGGASYVELL
jgi:hypothetical protein